ncbi:MAG: phage GP46 family protein [Methanogenium sp.]|jgi:phage gp46-like protein
MSDIKLTYDDSLMECDLSITDGDLTLEDGLETAILLSLFIDRRAEDDDELDNPNDKRGWWGDQVTSFPGDRIGSRLWLLERAKTDTETLRATEEYALEALEWMKEDGVVEDIEVEAYRVKIKNTEVLGLKVMLKKFEGNNETFIYDDLWNAQLNGGN